MNKIQHINIDIDSTNNFFVHFPKTLLESLLRAQIFVDGQKIGKVLEGKTVCYTLEKGTHEIMCKFLLLKSNILNIDVEDKTGIIIQPKLFGLDIYNAQLNTKCIKKAYIVGDKKVKNYFGGIINKAYLELSNVVIDDQQNEVSFFIVYDDNSTCIEKVEKATPRYEQLLNFLPPDNERAELDDLINMDDFID